MEKHYEDPGVRTRSMKEIVAGEDLTDHYDQRGDVHEPSILDRH